ncbi:MAG TPA: recombinase family protein [Planctomycetaceae bacterium]|nr:recombinase family protein [Planctomycetaceae bacterium]
MQRTEEKRTVRCAVYTRKSTEEGLEQEYNTLDAQRDAGEAYIRSQQHEGWVCLPDRYDDGGFTGANMDRPALRRLLADIEAGKVDCVVVYKVDRLSRSLLDFARIMEIFERHNVSFVSVTQAFSTASSMGRLVLNVLLSFAQFEREMISERTRDKIAAARRKGKWSGGMPVLGYDVVDTKLVVNPEEAERVREIFRSYLEHRSLLAVVKHLRAKGWRTKQWTTKKGTRRGGRPFNKNSLYQLLTNVVYVGKIRYKDEVHEGEHEAIVDARTFQAVQTMLRRNGRSGGRGVRNKYNALLRGLLRCAACNCGMSHAYTSKRNRLYRYYVCQRAQAEGWHSCPSPSVPAGEIERFVVDEIKQVGRDPALIDETLALVRGQVESQIKSLKAERSEFSRRLRTDRAELVRLAEAASPDDGRFAEVGERVRYAEQKLSEIEGELAKLEGELVSRSDVAAALGSFDAVWDKLAPREQVRLVELLVAGVVYDGDRGTVSITFRPSGLKWQAEELTRPQEDAA